MTEKRRSLRSKKHESEEVTVTYRSPSGESRVIYAKVLDSSETGLAVASGAPFEIGSTVIFGSHSRDLFIPPDGHASVVSCLARQGGVFRIGLSFDKAAHLRVKSDFIDYYEVLQVSPNADPETIHRVYRLLAQRYHPDNSETGDEEAFKVLLRADRVLGEPEKRAAYDVDYRSARQLRWRIFDQPQAAQGMEAEKRTRRGILSLLYNKRLRQPSEPYMNIMELEELLGCPREHLEFSLWYLKENSWIVRTDNGRYVITAKGVDAAEVSGEWQPPPEARLLLESKPSAL